MYYMKQFEEKAPQLSDLLLWGAMVDGPQDGETAPAVLLNKDGCYMTTLAYRGQDMHMMEPEERRTYLHRLHALKMRLGTGWATLEDEWHEPSTAYPQSTWDNPVACFLDASRRSLVESGRLHESQQFLTLLWKPPSTTKRTWFEDWFTKGGADTRTERETHCKAFVHAATQFLDAFRGIVAHAAWCTPDQTASYLRRCISWDRHPVALPQVPMYLDCQLTTPGGFRHGHQPWLAGKYLRPIAVRTWPTDRGQTGKGLSMDIPTALQQHLPFPYRYTVRTIHLDKRDSEAVYQDWQAKWQQLIWDGWAIVGKLFPSEAAAEAASLARATIDVRNDQVTVGYLTPVVTVWGETPEEVDAREREVVRVLQHYELLAEGETTNASQAWLGTLPGDVYHGVRMPPLPSLAGTILGPYASIWAGPERDRHLQDVPLFVASSDGVPFRHVMHQGEVGHFVVIGPTRSGKTALLGFMAMQFLRYRGAQVFAFDKDFGLYCPTLLAGGSHYVLAGSGTRGLHILGRVDENDEERRWAQEWIAQVLTAQGLSLSPTEKHEIWQALGRVARKPRPLRTLSTFCADFQVQRLKPGLVNFCQGGPYSLFDAAEDSFELDWWTTFEMSTILEMPEALPHAMDYIFHRLEQRYDGRPTLLMIDEAATVLNHPILQPQVRTGLTARAKKNVKVGLCWQQIKAGVDSPLWQDVKNSCHTQFYLPNHEALTMDVLPYYRELCGLPLGHVQALAMATTHQDYLVNTPEAARMFQLRLSPLERLICAASTQEEIATMRQLVSEEREEPLGAAWLRRWGMSTEADIYLQHYAH